MPGQFFSPEGDLEEHFITNTWLIDQYIGDQLYGWGSLSRGTLGNAQNTFSTRTSTPVTTFTGGTNWKQISCGSEFSAAIKTDGTLWTWGSGNVSGPSGGQLGNASQGSRSTPVTTFAGGNNWKQVSCGAYNTAAIKTDGTLWIWGRNDEGQLGINIATNDSTQDRSTPVTTFAGGTNWKQVSFGGSHVMAIKTDGTLWGWGGNEYVQLGTNDGVNKSTPVTTFAGGNNWKQVSCSKNSSVNAGFQLESFSAAIKTDGTLWVWGNNASNSYGVLGINSTLNINVSTPVTTIVGGTNWKQVSLGSRVSAAIKTDGTLWVWGAAFLLGHNSSSDKRTPVTTFLGGTNWKQVDCGHECASAIKTDGTLWTWGLNSNGELGTNDTTSRTTPVTTFAGGTNWRQTSSSNASSVSHQMAVTSGIPSDLPLS
jgi:alpha-tubulin suppressor-like RCC1 family protein